MNPENLSLSIQEQVIFSLRKLYRSYGYAQYKMSKFEEYDLYAQNKDFLISDSVITFTDTNGKLMALKPDVTLSIIKNIKDSTGIQKLFYNENVYRISKGNQAYKEIMQTGLECVGNVDIGDISEVITLAAKSLQSISPNCVLNITNLDLLSEILDSLDITRGERAQVLQCVEEKNIAYTLKGAVFKFSKNNTVKRCQQYRNCHKNIFHKFLYVSSRLSAWIFQ